MKVLQINSVYDKSSTGKIVFDIKTELDKNSIDNYVIFGRGKSSYPIDSKVLKSGNEIESNVSHFNSYLTGNLYGSNVFNTRKLIKLIRKINPDIVHIHCLNGYFVNITKLISFLKKSHFNTLITLHAEFMFTGTCGCSYDCEKYNSGCGSCPYIDLIESNFLIDNTHKNNYHFLNAFKKFSNLKIVSVSPFLENKSSKSMILSDFEHHCILNGVDTNTFMYLKNEELTNKFKNKKVILHVTVNFNRLEKGGNDFLKLAELNFNNKDLLFVIVGAGHIDDPLPKNVMFLGRTNNQKELAEIYSYASVSVVPSRAETFSMVVCESLCCGTPVIGYLSGGPETIAIEKYSKFSEYHNIDSLNKNLNSILSNKFDKTEISKEAHKKYSRERMSEEYISIYKSFLD